MVVPLPELLCTANASAYVSTSHRPRPPVTVGSGRCTGRACVAGSPGPWSVTWQTSASAVCQRRSRPLPPRCLIALAASSEAISTRSGTRALGSRLWSACAATARRRACRSASVKGSSRTSSPVSGPVASGAGLVVIDDHHRHAGQRVDAESPQYLGRLRLAPDAHPLPVPQAGRGLYQRPGRAAVGEAEPGQVDVHVLVQAQRLAQRPGQRLDPPVVDLARHAYPGWLVLPADP